MTDKPKFFSLKVRPPFVWALAIVCLVYVILDLLVVLNH